MLKLVFKGSLWPTASSTRLRVMWWQLIFPVLSPVCCFLWITYGSIHPACTLHTRSPQGPSALS